MHCAIAQRSHLLSEIPCGARTTQSMARDRSISDAAIVADGACKALLRREILWVCVCGMCMSMGARENIRFQAQPNFCAAPELWPKAHHHRPQTKILHQPFSESGLHILSHDWRIISSPSIITATTTTTTQSHSSAMVADRAATTRRRGRGAETPHQRLEPSKG